MNPYGGNVRPVNWAWPWPVQQMPSYVHPGLPPPLQRYDHQPVPVYPHVMPRYVEGVLPPAVERYRQIGPIAPLFDSVGVNPGPVMYPPSCGNLAVGSRKTLGRLRRRLKHMNSDVIKVKISEDEARQSSLILEKKELSNCLPVLVEEPRRSPSPKNAVSSWFSGDDEPVREIRSEDHLMKLPAFEFKLQLSATSRVGVSKSPIDVGSFPKFEFTLPGLDTKEDETPSWEHAPMPTLASEMAAEEAAVITISDDSRGNTPDKDKRRLSRSSKDREMRRSSVSRSRGATRGGATRGGRGPSPRPRNRRSPVRRARSPAKPRPRRVSSGTRSPQGRRRLSGSRKRVNSKSPSPRRRTGPARPRRMSKSPARRQFSPIGRPFRARSRSPSAGARRRLSPPKRARSRSRTPGLRTSLSPLRAPGLRTSLSPLRTPGLRTSLSPRRTQKMTLSPPPHLRQGRDAERSGPAPYHRDSQKSSESSFRTEPRRNEGPRNEPGMYRAQDNPLVDNRSGSPLPAMGSYDSRSKIDRYLEVEPMSATSVDTDLRHRSRRSPSPLDSAYTQPEKRYDSSVIPLLDGTTHTFRDQQPLGKTEDTNEMSYDLNLTDRPLLGERFGGDNLTDPGGRLYSHDELKKITVDIRRSIPVEAQSGMSRVINPQNVVVIRRPDEGTKPIFDRDEIRLAHEGQGGSFRGKGSEAEFGERRVVAIVKERMSSPHSETSSTHKRALATGSGGISEREDFQVQREQFENFGEGDEFRRGEQRRPTTLSEKWATYSERGRVPGQVPVAEKPAAPSQQMRSTVGGFFNSGERVDLPSRSQFSPERTAGSSMYQPRISEQYAEDRMRGGMYAQQQPDRHSSQHHHLQQQQHFPRQEDSRHELGGKRRSQIGEVRTRHNSPPLFERRTDRLPDDPWDKDFATRRRFRDDERNAPDTTTDPFYRDSYVGGMPRTEKDFRQEAMDSNLPNFASRPDKYRYQEWIDKPDMVPKGPSYYEHDTRGESLYDSSWFGRGRGRGVVPMRGRARARATPFARGRILTRGTGGIGGTSGGGVGGGGGVRGGMMAPGLRRKPSPNQWKHDMFSEISPDRSSEQDNKPTSTTEGK